MVDEHFGINIVELMVNPTPNFHLYLNKLLSILINLSLGFWRYPRHPRFRRTVKRYCSAGGRETHGLSRDRYRVICPRIQFSPQPVSPGAA
jgi:hypothetical protein